MEALSCPNSAHTKEKAWPAEPRLPSISGSVVWRQPAMDKLSAADLPVRLSLTIS